MDDQILRSIDGLLPPADERRLTQWRAEAPDHERRYQELARLSAALSSAAPWGMDSLPPAVDAILRRARPVPRSGIRWHAAAAIGATMAAAGLVGYLAGLRGDGRAPPVVAQEVIAGPSEASTVHLADGSVVRLGPASRLVAGERGPRDVWLEGTAFFAVAKRDGARFTVRTRGGTATVLGTRFEMKASDEQLRVVVVEGTVVVRNDVGSEVRLEGGQMAFTSGHHPPAVTRVPQPSRLLGWIGKVLLFRDTPLEQVAREIEDVHHPIAVVIEDTVLRRHLVTATFAEQPVDQLLSTLCQLLGAECAMTPDTVWIRPSGPGKPASGLADPQ